MAKVNDLNIHVATVNGSGSQSSNTILLRSIFHMGIPVSGKNLFPSNIQGLPTWFTIRANEAGWCGRVVDHDILVTMNRKTFEKDIKSAPKNSVVIHNSQWDVKAIREDLVSYPVPFDQLVKEATPDVKLRKLTINMIYVGVLAELLGIPSDCIDYALKQQFKDKQKVIDINRDAVERGRQFVREEKLGEGFAFALRPSTHTEGKILIEGNAAAALGAVFGGCQMVSWYPITPSSSVVEFITQYSERVRRDPESGEKNLAIIQAEDELAAVGMVIGASWMGARAMTTTSGPGISLMAEFVGYAFYTETPAVILNVQRVGPSTGMPTRTSQADLSFAANLGHGDTRHPLLLPGSPEECYHFMADSFDLAEQLQTPVFMLSDLDLGMNIWMAEPFEYRSRKWNRGKVLRDEDQEQLKNFYRYTDPDGDGIPYRTLPGIKDQRGVFFTRGSGHDKYGAYTEGGPEYSEVVDRLLRKKWETAKKLVPSPVLQKAQQETRIGLVAYGSSDEAVRESLEQLQQSEDLAIDYLRLRAYPFTAELGDFLENHDLVYVVEQNQEGQMRQLIAREANYASYVPRLESILSYDGLPLAAQNVSQAIVDHQNKQQRKAG